MPISRTNLPSLTPVICGPTAGGKSDLAVNLALTLRDKHHILAEIITADAFQVYQGLDIGTAKPTLAERRGVPHHLIDIVPPPSHPPSDISHPTRPFTLDAWLSRATATIADLRGRNILPIVVGGTHLYIKALLEGLFEGPKADEALRAELTAMDPAARRAELERVDPLAAQRIHPNDLRRTIRALEVFRLTGKPISAHQTQWDRPMSDGGCAMSDGKPTDSPPSSLHPTSNIPHPTFRLITLDWEPDALNQRINARVKQMIEQGLLDEIHTLALAHAFTPQSAEALGYKQLLPLVHAAILEDEWPPPPDLLAEVVEKIKIETRRFAKNQRTWLRRLSNTPGTIRLSAPPTPDSPAEAWLPRIAESLGLPV